MSYARWSGTSDVYVYASREEEVTCCGCILLDDEMSFHGTSTQEIVGHVEEHIAAGSAVPEGLIGSLIADDARNFPPLTTYPDSGTIPLTAAGEVDFDAIWEQALSMDSAVTRDAYAQYDRSHRRRRARAWWRRPRTSQAATDGTCRA